MSRDFEMIVDGAILFAVGFAFAKTMHIHIYNETLRALATGLGILFTTILINFFGFTGGLLLGAAAMGWWPLYFLTGALAYHAAKEALKNFRGKKTREPVP